MVVVSRQAVSPLTSSSQPPGSHWKHHQYGVEAVSRVAETIYTRSLSGKAGEGHSERDPFLIYASKRVPLSRFLRFSYRAGRRDLVFWMQFFVDFPVKRRLGFDHFSRDSRRHVPFLQPSGPPARVRARPKSLYDVGKASSVVLEVFSQPPPSLRARAGSPLTHPLHRLALELSLGQAVSPLNCPAPPKLFTSSFLCISSLIYLFNYIDINKY